MGVVFFVFVVFRGDRSEVSVVVGVFLVVSI